MFFLALRNVARHRAHSLLLAALFALAAFLFIAGNSLLAHSNRMLRELFVSTVTGDMVIAAESEASMSVFGANTPAIGELIPIPVLKQEGELAAALRELPAVEAATPLVSGAAVMDLAGNRRTVPVFGIEGEGYFSLLDGIEVTRGRRIAAGAPGVMLTERHLERLEREAGREIELGEEVLLSTAQDRRFRIRAAPLVGVFRYPVSMDYVDEIALVDANTVRALNRIQVRAGAAGGSGEAGDTGGGGAGPADGPRNASEVDELFSGGGGTGENGDASESADDGRGITAEEVLERVRGGGAAGSGDATADAEAAGDGDAAGDAARDGDAAGQTGSGGSAHFLLLRGEDSEALRETAARYGAQVLSWREAAGQAALLARLLQIVFNGGFGLFVVAVTLGATNIVLISTYRRTREIGTLRAIGTDDRELRGIFTLEHLLIAAAGWLVGLLATLGVSAAVARQSIIVDNQLIAMLLGGRVVRLPVDPVSVMLCLAVVLLVVAVSVLVPLRGVIRKPVIEAVRGI